MVAATSRLFDMCCDRIAESKGTARGRGTWFDTWLGKA